MRTSNEWNNWIEEAISKNYLKYYDYKHFRNIQEIGRGSFGIVFRANWKDSEQYFALKSFFSFGAVRWVGVQDAPTFDDQPDGIHAAAASGSRTAPFAHLLHGVRARPQAAANFGLGDCHAHAHEHRRALLQPKFVRQG